MTQRPQVRFGAEGCEKATQPFLRKLALQRPAKLLFVSGLFIIIFRADSLPFSPRLNLATANVLTTFLLSRFFSANASLMTPAAAMKGKSEGGKGAPESLASSRPAKRQRSGVITRRRGAAEWAAATEAAKVAATAAAPCTHSNVDSSQQQQDKTDSSDVPPLAQSNNNTINSNSKKQNQSRLASSRLQQKQQKRQLPAQEQAQQEDKEEDEVPVYRGGASPEPVEYRPSASPPPPAKRQRIARADIPAAVPRELLRVTDRLSGPHLPDTDEGHYVFTIGDNLTPRCRFFFTIRFYHRKKHFSKKIFLFLMMNCS